MYYSLDPSRYFLLSIFQVWSKYVKYPQLYEGENERTNERTPRLNTLPLFYYVSGKTVLICIFLLN